MRPSPLQSGRLSVDLQPLFARFPVVVRNRRTEFEVALDEPVYPNALHEIRPADQEESTPMTPKILSLHQSPIHEFSKDVVPSLRLLAGLGVEGDAHCGATVQHRSRVAVDPGQANLRQVHLIHSELLRELESEGFAVAPGVMGENILTANIDLLGLSTGTRLALGGSAVLEVTGLRNPCKQLQQIAPTLLPRLVHRDEAGKLIRLAGIMAIVLVEGEIFTGDAIQIERPDTRHQPLAPV